jgi:hypothetical protein
MLDGSLQDTMMDGWRCGKRRRNGPWGVLLRHMAILVASAVEVV